MSGISNNETSAEAEKPVESKETSVNFPPFPEPNDVDFDDDISEKERRYYMEMYSDLKKVHGMKLHCTACDRHLGSSIRAEVRMRSHPMLRTLMCNTCHSFYNSGEFDKGDDGSELYCRWCGQGGQVYCCSDCPVVFCAKCIKRNFGMKKITEIENTDDWKCFKCNPVCLWDLRAMCWAIFRYCDLSNKILSSTIDAEIKESYKKTCVQDLTSCCKNKVKRKPAPEAKKKEVETVKKGSSTITPTSLPTPALTKLPPTIQVKKFASINMEELKDKKPQKRPASPKNRNQSFKNAYSVVPGKVINPLSPLTLPAAKKIKIVNAPVNSSIRIPKDKMMPVVPKSVQLAPKGIPMAPKSIPMPPKNINMATYTRIRPKQPQMIMQPFNGYNNQFSSGFNSPGMFMGNNSGMFNNNMVVDNINLSLESLTQGLDMNAMNTMTPLRMPPNNSMPDNNDVVCTPDIMEPLCEINDENNDDDVQCMTPGPMSTSKLTLNPPPLIPRVQNALPDLGTDNIIQMTDNDVTVNAATGGLKFRIDPQTLSSNKMYRLPDGRIFAINVNPSMPGGYSATIVAVTDVNSKEVNPKKVSSKGGTYAAKLNPISPKVSSTPNTKQNKSSHSSSITPNILLKTMLEKKGHKDDTSSSTSRECDLNVPIEWFRYNLIDSVDALQYSLSRLEKMKQEVTTMYLRTRSVAEMRSVYKNLERLLTTSATRFNEIRENLSKEMRQYLHKKLNNASNHLSDDDDDDDDVEILNDLDDNEDDPIFVDENFLDTSAAEVDLTETVSSDHNDSNEKSIEARDPLSVSVSNEKFDNNDDVEETDKQKSEDLSSELEETNITNNDDPIIIGNENDIIGAKKDKEDNIIDDKEDNIIDDKEDNIDDKEDNIDDKEDNIDDKDDHIDDKEDIINSKEKNIADNKVEEEENIFDNKFEVEDHIIENKAEEGENTNDVLSESEGTEVKTEDNKESTATGSKETERTDKVRKEDSNAENNKEAICDNRGDIENNPESTVDLNDDQSQCVEMSEDLIDKLLQDDSGGGDADDNQDPNSMDITEEH